ncbi:hypothetical protein NLX86_19020 [Streptomyces sp. A3M-1-3]|uniref:helix-turn-helix domain-containing protein n=1 Tax=Streptomyces sp. A3M-1-3 TaxID=2962044 RepID=UPI0020B8F463|nr:helix-turn-helix domain-containing protein [Streptomyces sp. A3M-1-3]MCP3820111.1 hypothetical protein [Streptomyces sp. A3M-1-3]
MMGVIHPRRDEMRKLLEAGGISDIDIARQVGADRRTVYRLRRKVGIPGYRELADTCLHGHPYPENLGHRPNGWRYCKGCHRDHKKRYKAAAAFDEAAVERAAAGDPPERLSPREREAAVLRLGSHLSPEDIAERVRCTTRTVWRIRARNRDQLATAA